MDLRHLLTLRTVVDKGSFSQAAEELEISQPAVSFQIRSLEERLGHRLLDRSGRRVTLTEPGEVAYRYARRIIGLEAELEREMGELGSRVAGPLVIGSSTGPGEVLLPRLLGAFHRLHPDVRVSLVVSDTQTVCERVLDDELELGVVGAARPHRGLVFEPFVRDELVAIVPPDHPLAEPGVGDPRGARRRADAPAAGGLGGALGGGGRDARGGPARPGPPCGDGARACSSRSRRPCSTASASPSSRGWPWSARWPRAAGGPEARGAGLERHFFAVRHAGRTPKRVSAAFEEFARSQLGDMAALALVISHAYWKHRRELARVLG